VPVRSIGSTQNNLSSRTRRRQEGARRRRCLALPRESGNRFARLPGGGRLGDVAKRSRVARKPWAYSIVACVRPWFQVQRGVRAVDCIACARREIWWLLQIVDNGDLRRVLINSFGPVDEKDMNMKCLSYLPLVLVIFVSLARAQEVKKN